MADEETTEQTTDDQTTEGGAAEEISDVQFTDPTIETNTIQAERDALRHQNDQLRANLEVTQRTLAASGRRVADDNGDDDAPLVEGVDNEALDPAMRAILTENRQNARRLQQIEAQNAHLNQRLERGERQITMTQRETQVSKHIDDLIGKTNVCADGKNEGIAKLVKEDIMEEFKRAASAGRPLTQADVVDLVRNQTRRYLPMANKAGQKTPTQKAGEAKERQAAGATTAVPRKEKPPRVGVPIAKEAEEPRMDTNTRRAWLSSKFRSERVALEKAKRS